VTGLQHHASSLDPDESRLIATWKAADSRHRGDPEPGNNASPVWFYGQTSRTVSAALREPDAAD
jgi:hypothetical protein